MSNSIVRDMLEALEVQHINELMDDGKHYIIEVCKRIASENKKQMETSELERNAAIQSAVVSEERAEKAEAELALVRTENADLIEDIKQAIDAANVFAAEIVEMKQALSFDWDLFKSTQESLREHMQIIKAVAEYMEGKTFHRRDIMAIIKRGGL